MVNVKKTGIPFDESVIKLSTPETKQEILKYSPSGKVPLLKHNKVLVWESLAIGEYLAEIFPEAELWPQDQEKRTYARSISHEMHTGFSTLRTLMPFNLGEKKELPFSFELNDDIKRIESIWVKCLNTKSLANSSHF